MLWRLLVVDGADADRYFPLPESGTRIIGNSHKYSDICLNDLVMARIHCQVDVEDGRVKLTAVAEDRDTYVNGQKITEHELQPGEIIRIGNSHLRFEPEPPAPEVIEGFEEVDDDAGEIVEVVDGDSEEIVELEAADDDPPVVPADDPPSPPTLDWDHLNELTGHTLAHFEIGPVLGRGHFGVTFRARDTEMRREVALKVIGPKFPANADELKKFARAMAKTATIQNEHLVRFWSAGRSSKYVWISQEFVEGESLAELIKKPETNPKVRWRNALKLGIDIAQGLRCLYDRHIVHGDLTPTNVLIGLDRTAKLNDLMFDAALSGSEWYDEKLEPKLLAELPYLPPERLEERGYLNEVSDIYSLGTLIYVRLTGRPPFLGATPNQIIDKIQQGLFEKPKKIVKECPMDFQAAIMKMLAHNQEDRFQTPSDVVDALESIQAMPTL